MDRRSHYMQLLDFIVNHATTEEIKGIEMALDRRRSEVPAGVADLDFQKMANTMAGKLGKTLDFDIQGMSKRLVVEMILQKYPNISDQELQSMVDQFVPGDGVSRNEGLQIPKELRISMLDQFIRFSTGRMAEQEALELKRASTDWVNRYWSAFSPRHRELLGKLLKGEIDTDDFWRQAEGL